MKEFEEAAHSFEFKDFVLQTRPLRLFQKIGSELKKVPKTERKRLQVLSVLLDKAPELATWEDFFEKIWPDEPVEPGNITTHVSAIRRMIGQDCIESERSEGYRFVVPVRRLPNSEAVQHPSTASPSLPIHTEISIAEPEEVEGEPVKDEGPAVSVIPTVRRWRSSTAVAAAVVLLAFAGGTIGFRSWFSAAAQPPPPLSSASFTMGQHLALKLVSGSSTPEELPKVVNALLSDTAMTRALDFIAKHRNVRNDSRTALDFPGVDQAAIAKTKADLNDFSRGAIEILQSMKDNRNVRNETREAAKNGLALANGNREVWFAGLKKGLTIFSGEMTRIGLVTALFEKIQADLSRAPSPVPAPCVSAVNVLGALHVAPTDALTPSEEANVGPEVVRLFRKAAIDEKACASAVGKQGR